MTSIIISVMVKTYDGLVSGEMVKTILIKWHQTSITIVIELALSEAIGL